MFNLENLVRSPIRNLSPYSSARNEFQGKEGIFLDANENPFGTLNRYPDPTQKALKEKLSEINDIPAETIFIGNGSDEVIDLAYRIFCEPNKDKALTFSPTYGMYEVAAEINAVELIKLPLTKEFQLNMREIDQYLSDENLKLIFICSPNNPTGNLLSTEDIEFILCNFKGIIIIDEAYIEFSESVSWIRKLKDYPNLVVCRTLSKAWGLAGARIGMAYSSVEIIRFFNKVKPPYNVSLLNQEAALIVLSQSLNFERNRKTLLSEKKKLERELKKIPLIKKIFPSDANFLLIETGDANTIYKALVDKKVITRNRTLILNNCIRITVGSPEENKKLVNSLNEISNEKSTFYRP